jgi:hypothetical protein
MKMARRLPISAAMIATLKKFEASMKEKAGAE